MTMPQRFYCLCMLLVIISGRINAQNQPPEINNCTTIADTSGKVLKIRYDVSDREGDSIRISIRLSVNSGDTYFLVSDNVKGDIGFPVSSGAQKEMEFSYAGISALKSLKDCKIKIIAEDNKHIDIQSLIADIDTASLKRKLLQTYGVRNHKSRKAKLKLEEVRQMITADFNNSGLNTYTQDSVVDRMGIKNIIGKKKGMAGEGDIYILCAHYDTVDDAPGADDNASGIAGMLEAVKVLSKYQFKNTLVFIGFDKEEEGLYGSSLYVFDGGIKVYERVKGVINFDMIGCYSDQPNSQQIPAGFESLFPDAYRAVSQNGFKGDFVLNVSNENSRSLAASFQNMAKAYVPTLNVVSLETKNKGGDTPQLLESDHAPFWDRLHPAIHIGDGAGTRNKYYHSKNDKDVTINYRFLSDIVKASIITLASLAEVQHSTAIVTGVDIIH